MHNFLKRINKILEPYYALLSMLGFFITIFIAIYNFVITPSNLKISIQTEQIEYPSSVDNEVKKLFTQNEISDSAFKSSSFLLFDFIVNTTNHSTFILSNKSSKILRGVKFKYLNVNHLTASSVTADFQTTKENEVLLNSIQYDQQQKIVSLNSDIDIPSNSNVTISLWGNFAEPTLDNNIIANYDEGEAFVENSYTINGLKGYIINFYVEIIICMLILFSLVYLVGIQQMKKKYALQKNNI